MKPEEKIFIVMDRIKQKIDISPVGDRINYRAGEEETELSVQEEISILNKLHDEGVISIEDNYGSDFI